MGLTRRPLSHSQTGKPSNITPFVLLTCSPARNTSCPVYHAINRNNVHPIRHLSIHGIQSLLSRHRNPSYLVFKFPTRDLHTRASKVLERWLSPLLDPLAASKLHPRSSRHHATFIFLPPTYHPAPPEQMETHIYYTPCHPCLDPNRHSGVRFPHTDNPASGSFDAVHVLVSGVVTRRAAGLGKVVGRVERHMGIGVVGPMGHISSSRLVVVICTIGQQRQ